MLIFAIVAAVPSMCFSAPKRIALLVGINHYRNPAIPALNGCINDILGFRDLLVRKFGFAPPDIVTLTDEKAGHKAIMETFRSHLIEKAAPGDEVVFYYAGHGSTVADLTRASGHEQTIVPWDSRDPEGRVFDITDSELRVLVGDLKKKTEHVTVILDSCHSGTAVRGALARSIPEDKRPQPPRSGERDVPALAGPSDRGILYIAGSRSDQVSFEHVAKGTAHGAMSYFLARELSSAAADATWRDVMDRVRSMVSARYPSQEPQLEGGAADRLIFGGAGSAAEPYYLVSPRGRTAVSMNAGSIQGIAAGSIFDVYSSGTKDFGQATAIARIEVVRASSFNSDANIVSGGPIAEGSRAIERERRYGDFRFRIYWENASASQILSDARDSLSRESQFEMTNEAARADMLVRTLTGGIQTAASDGTPLSPTLDAAGRDTLPTLTARIRSWAKWYQILSLDNPTSARMVSLRIEPVEPRMDGRIVSGDRLRVVITNGSKARLFVTLLDLARTGSISVVPLTVEGAREQVAPGQSLVSIIEAYVPEGQKSATDFLKVFATKTAVDFRMLTMNNIREASTATDPLTRLFAGAMTGDTRDVRPVNIADWAAAMRQISVLR